jgi:hypothetical protein
MRFDGLCRFSGQVLPFVKNPHSHLFQKEEDQKNDKDRSEDSSTDVDVISQHGRGEQAHVTPG